MQSTLVFKSLLIVLLLAVVVLGNLPIANAQHPNIHLSCLSGDIESVKAYIEEGGDLNARDAYGSTPLGVALTFGKDDVAIVLVQAGADLDMADAYGSTPLHLAAVFCREKVIPALLQRDADLYARNVNGATPYDIVAAPYARDTALYDQFRKQLGPLGWTLDASTIQQSRPRMRKMLRPSTVELASVDYKPVPGKGWQVSAPQAEGLDKALVDELYFDAERLEKIYSLLIVKNGQLVAEKYFNGKQIDERNLVQSVSKSYMSALVGIAHQKGCIPDLDQRMMDFFPEFQDSLADSRIHDITIRHLLQMRSGYAWEESDTAIWNRYLEGDQLPLVATMPLVNDPGEGFNYSNMSTYLLGVIVSRACQVDFRQFAWDNLFAPMHADTGSYFKDIDNYYYPFFSYIPRDQAKFGQMYLDGGKVEGVQILETEWVNASLGNYSDDAWVTNDRDDHIGRYFMDLGYGYQWWSATVGGRRVDYAAGHGGQFILLVNDLDMVLVLNSDPFFVIHNGEAWKHEQSNYNLLGKFLAMLPDPAR